jgi:hypothetical protein
LGTHLPVAIEGHRRVVVPAADFVSWVDPATGLLRLASGGARATFAADPSKDSPEAAKLADSIPSEFDGPWRLATSAWATAWPTPFRAQSTNWPNEPSLIDLIGSNDELVFVQSGPPGFDLLSKLPSSYDVEHVETQDGRSAIVARYEVNTEAWTQRYRLVDLHDATLMFIGQCPSAGEVDNVAEAVDMMAAALITRA